MDFAFELSVIVGLTLLNGFFSASEIAVLSVRKTRLAELVDEGSSSAEAVLRLRHDPERFLATVQIGITVVGATAGAFGGATLEAPLAAFLASLGVGRLAGNLALAIVVALVSYLSIVLGELVPKSLALRSSERISLVAARPLLALSVLARPLVWFLTLSSNVVLRPFRDSTTFVEARLSPEELQQLVDEASEVGSIDPQAAEIASRAIDLEDLRIAALVVPRARVVALHVGITRDEAWDVLTRHPHARYPVLGDDSDGVTGYVTYRDVVTQIIEKGEVDLASILRQVPFFPTTMLAIDALRLIQERRSQLGIVVDEQGSFLGLVTVEDVAEELFGDILGEHEKPVELFHRIDADRVVVHGTMPVHEVNRELDLDLPEGPGFTTVAGLVIHEAGHLPRVGEMVELDGELVCEVVEATPKQVVLVELRTKRDAPRER